MAAKYRIGNLDVAVLSDGLYYQDAGAVFGIIPKLMWEKVSPPLDRHHRVPLGLNSLLVRSAGRLVLIETGMGDKGNDRRLASPLRDGNLISELETLGVRPPDIDMVVNTHLHSDHCGWNTRMVAGALVPTFPNAEYVVTRAEWEAAMEPDERTRGTYFADNLLPLQEHGRLNLAEGEKKLTDELTLIPTPGHSAGHASIVLSSGGETAIYIGDIVQMAVQLERTAWVSSFDIMPLVSMQTKKALVERAIDDGSLIIGVHLPYPGGGRLKRTEQGQRRWVAEAAEPYDHAP